MNILTCDSSLQKHGSECSEDIFISVQSLDKIQKLRRIFNKIVVVNGSLLSTVHCTVYTCPLFGSKVLCFLTLQEILYSVLLFDSILLNMKKEIFTVQYS